MPQTEAKEIKKLEKALHNKLRLHVEAEMQKQSILVREQVTVGCPLQKHHDTSQDYICHDRSPQQLCATDVAAL